MADWGRLNLWLLESEFGRRFDLEPADFGFPFASYRAVLQANRWHLHEYVGTLRRRTAPRDWNTRIWKRNGASGTGDNETASMFFIRELRYRRRRYAAHAGATNHSIAHRADAALGWATNRFLALIAGYSERPQRTLALALAVIVSSALAYPVAGGFSRRTRLCATAVTARSPRWMAFISAS